MEKEDKIVSLLAYMSRYELNRFRKFLLSPYFNEKREILDFFGSMEYFIRRGKPDWTRQQVWKRAFPKNRFSEQKYRRYASDLTKLGYRFFSLEWHERDGLSGQEGVLKKVNTAPLSKHYRTALRNFRKDMKDHGLQDSDYYYYKYVSEYESHIHLERVGVKLNTLSNLKDADHALDIYYIINKLKHHCDVLNYKKFSSIEISISLLPRLYEFIFEKDYMSIPAVRIYYNISKTLTDPLESKYYFELVELLEKHFRLFSPMELRTMYIYATNYCITRINEGQWDFFEVLYDLYAVLLERRTIFNHENELDERHYRNIISIGLRLKDYGGVEEFINKYSPDLPKGIRENALTFNLAHLYFAQKEYDKVVGLLRFVEYNDVVYNISGRNILLKTYYETNEMMAFDAQLESFSIYIRRNQVISQDKKSQYLHFFRFAKKLRNIPRYDKGAFRKLEDRIRQAHKVANKEWLLEKLGEMLGRA